MSLVQLADFKKYVSVTRTADGADDILLQSALDSAEDAVNQLCQRKFVVAGTSATTRSYVPPRGEVLRIHDATTIVSVTVDGVAVDAADRQAEPVNQLAGDGSYRPYEQVRLFDGWPCPYPSRKATIAVEATWGWETIPSRIYDAIRILAKDLVSNRELSFGLVATDQAIARARENPQVLALLNGLRRAEALFGISG